MTKGEYRVGVTFNPSLNGTVSQIKMAAAGLIDMIEEIEAHPDGQPFPEVMRLKSLAQTAVEEAAMWAVKAATKPLPQTDGETK